MLAKADIIILGLQIGELKAQGCCLQGDYISQSAPFARLATPP